MLDDETFQERIDELKRKLTASLDRIRVIENDLAKLHGRMDGVVRYLEKRQR